MRASALALLCAPLGPMHRPVFDLKHAMRAPAPKRAAWQRHIDALARELGCRVDQRDGIDGMMYVEKGFVEGPVLRNQFDYVAILHELGHFALGHTQGRPPHEDKRLYFDNGVLRSEAQAWEWAMDRALGEITEDTRREMLSCLNSYFTGWQEAKGKPSRLPNGDRAYVEFICDEPDRYFFGIANRIRGERPKMGHS